ncbi:Protein of unknown function [Bacillus wiedmannii]|uniref:Uncharacterized protein n=1 Tax=Bacillus wiedmannii TaxID=1890302 RepID=A0AB37Z1X3_9BACI|nr:Protein of unknown function [Bacillus wiedmannii]
MVQDFQLYEKKFKALANQM